MGSHSSPYLEAIQAVPGSTPGQKYKELNRVARAAAEKAKSQGDVGFGAISLTEVPEPLLPLVRLETAKILRRNEVIVEALKSEDHEIVDRALKIDWFFRASNKEIINVDYFERNLYPVVSMVTRDKLIKKLSTSLSGAPSVAEAFYKGTLRCYGINQASPLLRACSESFLWETIIGRKLILSCRMINILFDKYPETIIRYLKLSKKGDGSSSRNLHSINICDYNYFLPRLIKNHLSALIELIEMHDSCFSINLSNKATERFLKGNVEVVLNRPILYTQMMPLKVIAAKITKSQYKRMFAKVFPYKQQNFSYSKVQKYLAYYPEQERITLLLETYEKVYKADLLENTDAVDENILQMLPTEERVRQARTKLEKQPDWHASHSKIETMWRCYLPLEDAISSIRTEISKTSSPNDRSLLLQQMLFVCRVNDDKDALVKALTYFTQRHKNENTFVHFQVLSSLAHFFDLSTLGKDHWSVIDDFIKLLYVKNELTENTSTSARILGASIYFKLTHDLPFDDIAEMLIAVNFVTWNASWCIFEKHPEYDKRCFEKLMEIVGRKYPADDAIWSTRRMDILGNITKSLTSFNERTTGKNTSTKIDKLSIKNYAWLMEAIERLIKDDIQRDVWKLNPVFEYLQNWEPELYQLWKKPKPKIIGDVKSGEALMLLKADPKNILDHCDEYVDSLRSSLVQCEKRTQRFIKTCRWYQHIPIKFHSKCLEGLTSNRMSESLMILAVLLEGPSFSQLVEPMLPKDNENVDTSEENAKLDYHNTSSIPYAMNLVNPPLPLNFIKSFCRGDFLSLGLSNLINVSRRTNVNKVEEFAKQLTDQRVSVKKHGIRIFCLVASIQKYREFLLSLWTTEKHRSIREVIFTKIHDLFVNDPNDPDNFKLLKDCIGNLGIDDDDVLDKINNYHYIPDIYIDEYVTNHLETLERLESSGIDDSRITRYFSSFLHRIDQPTSRLLSDQLSQKLVEKFFCKIGLSQEVISAGMKYTLNSYLRADPSKLEERLIFFGNFYKSLLEKHWNQADSKVSTYFPINSMTHKFVHYHVVFSGTDEVNVAIMKTILKSFLAVLEPQQDWTTYALLTYGVALADAHDVGTIADRISETLPSLVETITSVLVIELDAIIKKWIDVLVDTDHVDYTLYRIIENLCNDDTPDSFNLAAKLLFRSKDPIYDETRNEFVQLLQNCQYPVAVSLASHHVNTSN